MKLYAVLALVVALGACASHQVRDPLAPTPAQLRAASVWARPIWTARATVADFAAQDLPIGRVVTVPLDCIVQADASVACVPHSHVRRDARYAQAALVLSRQFRVSLTDAQNESTLGKRVRLILRFG